jgi:S1-C subfamily serine protease
VVSLAAGGPAEAGGILPGDIILALDGQAALRPRGVAAMLGAMQVGQDLPVRLLRAGQATAVTIRLGARPSR